MVQAMDQVRSGPRTPNKIHPEIAAMTLIERDGALSDDAMDDAFFVIKNKLMIGEVFMSYNKKATRMRFLSRRIEDYRLEKLRLHDELERK